MFNPFNSFPLFSCFVVFLFWYAFVRHRITKKEKYTENIFWDKETLGNSTRRKDISNLNFISISISEFPFGICSDPSIADYEMKIQDLSGKKIANFTGLSNTELKIKYGAPNLTELTEYDTNFTLFVSTLQKWANRLYDLNYKKEARILLESAIKSGSDIKSSYVLLTKIYDDLGCPSESLKLNPYAEILNSLNKTPILNFLEEHQKFYHIEIGSDQ